MKFLDLLGLTEFFNNLKTYFAPLIHKHTKADIEDLVEVQSDWNQNNPEATDYIKNKPGIPTEEGIMAMLSEAGVIEPLYADANTVYTDSNGAVYIL